MLFDLFIQGAFWLAISLIGFSLGLMVVVLLLHRRNARYRRRVDSLVTIWTTALEQTMRGEACDLSVTKKGTAVDMLRTWCDVSETAMRQTNTEALIPPAWAAVARQAGVEALARRFIEHGDAPERTVGARVLGLLGDASARSRIVFLCSDKDGDVSFAAATALVRLDASCAGVFVAGVRDRSDWNAPQVGQTVRENAPAFGTEFVAAARDANEAGMRRLLEFLPMLDRDVVRAVVMNTLERAQPQSENLPAALRALRSFAEPADIPLLEHFAGNHVAAVRVQAVNALGEIDDPQVKPLLSARLDDPDSWVRRRAKEALAHRADPEELPCFS